MNNPLNEINMGKLKKELCFSTCECNCFEIGEKQNLAEIVMRHRVGTCYQDNEAKKGRSFHA